MRGAELRGKSVDEFATRDFNIDRVPVMNTNANTMRHFGWFDLNPAVTFRTINESAVVAEAINRRLAARR